MKGKRKFILILLFLFGFKKIKEGKVLIYGIPLAKDRKGNILYSSGYLLKTAKDSFSNLPYISNNDIQPDSYKMNSALYPLCELLYLIKTEYPDFYKRIKSADYKKIKIYTHDGKKITFGLGTWEKKMKYLLKNINKKDSFNLELISFLEGGFIYGQNKTR